MSKYDRTSRVIHVIVMYGTFHFLKNCGQGPVSRKSQELFGRKTLTRSFCKAGLFICCKWNKKLNPNP